jgi:hypothetical protein
MLPMRPRAQFRYDGGLMRCPAEPFRYDEVRVIDNKTASSSTADLWIVQL